MKESPSQANKHGKIFERFVNERFKELYKTFPCRWERVIDAAAAGSTTVRTAESDFKLQVCGANYGRPFVFSIECKASVNNETFATCFRSLVKHTAKMRLAMRAGTCGIYLFEAVNNEDIEVWDARIICEAWPLKRQKFYGRPALVVSRGNFEEFALRMVKQPQDLIDQLLRTR